MIVAGIGCQRGCLADNITNLVRRAEAIAACRIGTLAAPRFKEHEAGLHGAAQWLGVPLLLVDEAALAAVQPRCPTRSEAAARHTGFASVAEAAALAAFGGRLLLARISGRGATCALAIAEAVGR